MRISLALAMLAALVTGCSRDPLAGDGPLPVEGGVQRGDASVDATVDASVDATVDATVPVLTPCGNTACGPSQVCQHFVCQNCALPVDGGGCPAGSMLQMFGGPPFCNMVNMPACVTTMAFDQEPPTCIDIPADCTASRPCECFQQQTACGCDLNGSDDHQVQCWCY
jgi:hypothetical protein